jgi:hypothetical protein
MADLDNPWLAEWYGYRMPRQDFDALLRSLPAEPRPTPRLQQVHQWLTRNVLEPAQYAAFYPSRVASRYMNPTAEPGKFFNEKTGQWEGNFWNTRSPLPGARIARPQDWRNGFEAMQGADAIAGQGYQPGERQSEMIERRGWFPGMSPWTW